MVDKPVSASAPKAARPFWLLGGIWSIVTLLAIGVAFLSNSREFLGTVAEANRSAAQAVATVTPSALIGDFQERMAYCDYRWMVFCEAKVPDPDCLLTARQCEAIALQRQRAIG